METGTLKVKTKTNKKGNTKKSYEFFYTNSQGQYRSLQYTDIPEAQIDPALRQKVATSAKITLTVEFEEEGNQILKLREQGQSWTGDRQEPTTSAMPEDAPKTVNPAHFHNPYNFVPALPRDTVTNELGDHRPVGHGKYHRDRWTGRIAVKLTTVTPLLIPDASQEATDNNDHKTYPVRLGADGQPYLPPTSIKGMLRSAYEAVTNSRLGIFENHDARLAYRMPANIGLEMVPARIEGGQVVLYPGTSRIGNSGKPIGEMYAAWLPRYDRRSDRLRSEVRYANGSLPQHGDHVKFWAEKFEKVKRNGNPIFTYWKVREIVRAHENLGNKPQPSRAQGRHQPLGNDIQQFEGYVYITNKNIDSKHDERIFIINHNVISLSLTDELRNKWRELIANYQEIHIDDIRKGWTSPPALNCSHWSRHIVSGEQEQKLEERTLCYAHVQSSGNNHYEIRDLYPVMITRGLFKASPASLLDPSLKPAQKKEELSPADRVFGWVNQNGKGSYKGHLRVHSSTCLSDDAIDNFGSETASVPLAILGQPKPQQARFYCADDREGQPIPNGEGKEEGYKYDDQSLRGRKVYPHHQGLPADYWSDPTTDRTQQSNQGHYQEYRRPQKDGYEQKDDQNRSLKNWVKPGVEFEFDIDVTNLSAVELGALLWLLSSPDIHFHRLGGAKPLGFGSIWLGLNWDQTDLRLGSDWIDFYKSLESITADSTAALECIDIYKQALVQSYAAGERFEQVSFISAFCQSTQGFSDSAAIRYPRVTPHPTPEGEAFKWFTENDKQSRQESGLKLSLPDLNQPKNLPIRPINNRPS